MTEQMVSSEPTAPPPARRQTVPGADPNEGADRTVGQLRLRGPILERLWTDGSPRDRYDLREWELSFEIRRRRGLAFLSSALIGVLLSGAYQIGVMWAWVLAVGLSSLLIAFVASGLARRPYLVLARDGYRIRLPIPSLTLEGFRDLFLDLSRIRLEALAAAVVAAVDRDPAEPSPSESQSLRRHEDDDFYHPQPLVDDAGAVTYALSCRDLPQLFEAISLCYRGTVRAMRGGEAPGMTGPIRFTVNAAATPRSDAADAAVAACLAECVAWSRYSGDGVPAGVDWTTPDEVDGDGDGEADADGAGATA